MNRPPRGRNAGLLFLALHAAASTGLYAQTPEAAAQYLPDHWPKEELKRYLALQNEDGFDWEDRKRIEPQRSAASSKAMIAGTSEPLAVHAGLEVLRHGGNAADAALTTS